MKIFAYIDRSAFAESVWRHAVWAANQLNVGVELVHVLDHPMAAREADYSGHMTFDLSETALEERMTIDEEYNRMLIEEGRSLLDAVAEHMRDAGVAGVTQRLFQGSILEHLEEHAGEAVLVVIGRRGEGAHRDPLHLGRNIERLVRQGLRPIVIVGEEFTPITAATIAWDGGKSAGEAIHFLVNRPLLDGVATTLLYVTDRDRIPAGLGDARAHLHGAGIDVSVETREGSVVKAILEPGSRDHAHLTIIGAYGHSRIRQLIVGSTTTEIMLRATSPLLVFH